MDGDRNHSVVGVRRRAGCIRLYRSIRGGSAEHQTGVRVSFPVVRPKLDCRDANDNERIRQLDYSGAGSVEISDFDLTREQSLVLLDQVSGRIDPGDLNVATFRGPLSGTEPNQAACLQRQK